MIPPHFFQNENVRTLDPSLYNPYVQNANMNSNYNGFKHFSNALLHPVHRKQNFELNTFPIEKSENVPLYLHTSTSTHTLIILKKLQILQLIF